MIDFRLTPEQEELVNLARKFAQNEMRPKAAQYDREEKFPRDLLEKAHGLGLLNLRIPPDYGGLGLGCFDECLVVEEFGAACAGMTTTFMSTSLALRPILVGGSEEQKRRWLPGFVERPLIAAFALTEPDSGSDAAGLGCTLRREGDDYLINGTKRFCTNGSQADLITLFATLDRTKRDKAICAIVVEKKKTKGLAVAKDEDKMGIRCSATSELVFEDARVPAANLLGREGEGFKNAMKTLDNTRPWIAAMGVGVTRAAIDHSLDYAMQRRQFGRPLIDFQATQFKLAQMAMEMEAARMMTWKSAWMIDHDLRASKESSIAKAFASDTAMRATTEAVQIHGGYGYIKEYPVEKLMRDAKILQIYEGANEIQRMVIARELMRSRGG
ncbi:MAG: acyl-CoA dehydrogenase family protein [Euryarchaeota archaeon]|nr:acyl-CoA dehydrogenase family protein [Euryarchaeota archaeon]